MSRLRARITKAAEREARQGHPWIFAESILELNRDGEPGELCVLYDSSDRFLAVGLYDPESPLRVRIVSREKGRPVNDELWRSRFEAARARRAEWFQEGGTNGYRVIHGESEGWPGAVVDRYGDAAVMKLYTSAWLPHLSGLARIVAEGLRPKALVLRLSRNVAESKAAKRGGLQDGALLHGELEAPTVVFLENGLKFEADVLRGQKTGFFLDQRENRKSVASFAEGKSLLNVFSFSGGFALYAAAHGARTVANLDISAHALASAERNFRLNEQAVGSCARKAIQADAFEWLSSTGAETYDIIVLDPPALAKRQSERPQAIEAYSRLAALGAAKVRRGGLLVAASCSAHVPKEEFFKTVLQSVARTRRSFLEIMRAGHPPDHPAAFREAEYLKCIYLRFD